MKYTNTGSSLQRADLGERLQSVVDVEIEVVLLQPSLEGV